MKFIYFPLQFVLLSLFISFVISYFPFVIFFLVFHNNFIFPLTFFSSLYCVHALCHSTPCATIAFVSDGKYARARRIKYSDDMLYRMRKHSLTPMAVGRIALDWFCVTPRSFPDDFLRIPVRKRYYCVLNGELIFRPFGELQGLATTWILEKMEKRMLGLFRSSDHILEIFFGALFLQQSVYGSVGWTWGSQKFYEVAGRGRLHGVRRIFSLP